MMSEEQADLEAENRLRPLLTDEFLDTLKLAARTAPSWLVDPFEVTGFVKWCHELAGKPFAISELYDDSAS